MSRLWPLASSLILLAACAGTPKAPDPARVAKNGPNDPKMVCTYEAPTGSHLPIKRCRDEADAEAQRQEMQDIARRGLEQSRTAVGH